MPRQKNLLSRSRISLRAIALSLRLCALLFFPAWSSTASAVDIVYTYDDLNRVTVMSHGGTSSDPTLTIAYDEVSNITSANITNSPDTDNDGSANFADPDDDNDQMPDAWEVFHGLNPLSAADANSDLDLDGITARNEYLNGTDPNDAQNIPESDIPLLPPWAMALLGLLLFRRLTARSRRAE
jgi:hypothetical protein